MGSDSQSEATNQQGYGNLDALVPDFILYIVILAIALVIFLTIVLYLTASRRTYEQAHPLDLDLTPEIDNRPRRTSYGSADSARGSPRHFRRDIPRDAYRHQAHYQDRDMDFDSDGFDGPFTLTPRQPQRLTSGKSRKRQNPRTRSRSAVSHDTVLFSADKRNKRKRVSARRVRNNHETA